MLHSIASIDLQAMNELESILVMNSEDERRWRGFAKEITHRRITRGAHLWEVVYRTASQLRCINNMVRFRHSGIALGINCSGQRIVRGGGDEQLEAGDACQISQRPESLFGRV